MKKIYFVFLFVLCSIYHINAQMEDNNWYFGDRAAISFTSGTPVALSNNASFTYDNSSTVSDSAGNLLFYTNGDTVWNKNNAVMYNGLGLLGSNNSGQCTIIVKQPQSNSIYYIFTNDQDNGPKGFRYSIVDLSQQGGLGAVTTKNVLLFAPCTEKMAVTYDDITNSFWVLTHTWASSNFNCYKLSSTGLDTIPVVSTVGSLNDGGTIYGYNAAGQMTFSNYGNEVASCVYDNGTIELFDFDKSTGILSNARLMAGYFRIWGVAFSPNDSLLYITQWTSNNITQFNLYAGSVANIMSSATVIGQATSTNPYYSAGYLQIARNNKIYVARCSMNYIGVINYPNVLGTSCGFVNNGVYLGPYVCIAGLSRVAYTRSGTSVLNAITSVVSQTCVGHCNGSATAYPQGGTPPYTYLWSTTPPQTTATADSLCSGTYTVTITDCSGNTTISHVIMTNYPNPTPTISADSANWTVHCNQTYNSYQWYFNGSMIAGATNQDYTPTQNGNYSVWVTNSNGCTAMSVKFDVGWLGIAEIKDENSILIFPNPANEDITINSDLSSKNVVMSIYNIEGQLIMRQKLQKIKTTINISLLERGMYFVKMSTDEGMVMKRFIKE